MRFNFLYICWLCVIGSFVDSSAKAQYAEKDFIHYTVKDGLSENYITSLMQDEWGYMWIGTDIGLNRFDGHSFKSFFQGTKTLPLLSSAIAKLKSFGPHHIGIINRGGFQLLDTRNLGIKNYVIADSTAFSVYHNAAWDAVAINESSFAVSTASGFYVFDTSGQVKFSYDAYKINDIGQKRILYGRDIFKVSNKELLVYINTDGLALYNAEEKMFKQLSEQNTEWRTFFSVKPKDNLGWTIRYQLSHTEFIFLQFAENNMLYHNRDKNITVSSPIVFPQNEFTWESKITWLNDSSFLVTGGFKGFYQFYINRKSGTITSDLKKNLPDHKIQCLYLDKEKRLWAGTSKGLLQHKLTSPVINTYEFKNAETPSITEAFNCAYRYADKLYLGRFSLNKGLLIIDTAGKKVIKQIEFYGKNLGWNEVISIQNYHIDTLWIGTSKGLLWLDTKSYRYGKVFDKGQFTDTTAITILAPVGKDGYAWMCGLLNGVLARYHPATRSFKFFTSQTQPALPFTKIKSIAYDAYGDVWIGGHSLARWSSKQQIFDTLISVYGGANKFEDNILALTADKKGSLWLHNVLNGLLEYRIAERRFVNYSMKDGLPSNAFYGFSPVINNQLWMTGHNQLTAFNTLTKKITLYDYQNGLPEDKPSGHNLYFDEQAGVLYLFNQHKVSTLHLPLTQANGSINAVVIEALIINNEQYFFYPVSGLRLKPFQNNLSLNFTTVDFEAGKSYQFAYKLTQAEDWTNIGEQRNINLTGLAPGNYTIWIKATGKSGLQKIQEFSFVIAHPFWKTSWFLLAVFILLAGLLYLFFLRRIKQIKEKANLDKQLSQAEMKALHAQMNPHFIFNSLNSIREMILTNENKEASHFLSKFAHLIRLTLDHSGQPFISLRNAMDYLHRYIEMEQIRNSYFTCRFLADEDLDVDETRMPPMLIQPFIENAIWHGTTGTKKNININIDFIKQGNQLVCIIEDSGIGINQSIKNKHGSDQLHHSVGIENVTNRIRLLNEKYALKSRITIEDKTAMPGRTGTGTVVTISIPLEIE